MTEFERFLRQARPDCQHCGGTGLTAGVWERRGDNFCVCVPMMIIRVVVDDES